MNKALFKHAATIMGMAAVAITVTTIRYAIFMPAFL